MMKQPNMLFNKRNAELARSLKTRLIILAARRSSDVFNATSSTSIDVVWERKESITTARNFRELAEPVLSFLVGEEGWDFFEVLLPFVPIGSRRMKSASV